jgi:hypothetical protein
MPAFRQTLDLGVRDAWLDHADALRARPELPDRIQGDAVVVLVGVRLDHDDARQSQAALHCAVGAFSKVPRHRWAAGADATAA